MTLPPPPSPGTTITTRAELDAVPDGAVLLRPGDLSTVSIIWPSTSARAAIAARLPLLLVYYPGCTYAPSLPDALDLVASVINPTPTPIGTMRATDRDHPFYAHGYQDALDYAANTLRGAAATLRRAFPFPSPTPDQ